MESVARKNRLHIDWMIIFATLALVIIGLLTIYSTGATHSSGAQGGREFYMQFVWFIVGVLMFFLTISLSYNKYVEWTPYLYIGGLLLLGVSLLFPPVKGIRAWINLGLFNIQPAELMKICIIISLARFLDMLGDDIQDIRNFFITFLILVPPLGIIAIQPDFGTGLVFFAICFAMLFIAGARIGHILSLFLLGFLGAGIPMFVAYYKEIGDLSGWLISILSNNAILIDISIIMAVIALLAFVIWFFSRVRPILKFASAIVVIPLGLIIAASLNSYLQPYQRKRIVVFVDPEKDPWGAGYNIIQSKIAIGSGGFAGKGYMKGTQNALDYLPEKKTDFVYSTLGEEWGFIGSLFLISLYFVFLYRGVRIAYHAKDMLGSLIAAGIVAMFAFHIFINIGMATGMMPVTGLPLPFVSYGGSSLMTNLIAVGLLFNIEMRRYVH